MIIRSTYTRILIIRAILVSALVLGALGASNLMAQETPAPTPEEAKTIQEFSTFFGYMFGERFKSQGMIIDGDAFAAAFKAALKGEPEPFNKDDLTRVQEAYSAYTNRVSQTKNEATIKAGKEFLAAQEKKADWKKTASGIVYRIEKEGSEPRPTASSTVKVQYVGSLIDGTVFNDSREMGGPIEFPLNGVIPGWTEGLQLVGTGGIIDMYLPSELAYGAQAQAKIPAHSVLHFRVEVLEVK